MTVLVSVTVSLRTLKLDYNSNAKYWNRAVASMGDGGGGGDAVVVIIEAERRKEEKDVGGRRGCCSSLRVDSLFEVVAVMLLLLLQGLLARRRRSRRPWAWWRGREKKGLILCSSWSSCFVLLLGTVMVLALPSQATPCQQPHYIHTYGLDCLASTYWMRSHARARAAMRFLNSPSYFQQAPLVTEVWESLFTATRPASLTTAAAAAACWPTRQRRRGWRGLESCYCCCCYCCCWIPFQLLLSGNSYWL